MVCAIIPAAGTGKRFGSVTPKQFLHIKGKPVLAHTVAAFQSVEAVDEIILAVPPGFVETTRGLVNEYAFTKVVHIIEGKKSRAESIIEALYKMSDGADIVLVHDGVRPLVSRSLINAVIAATQQHRAAITAVPVTDTLKKANAAGFITETCDRSLFYQVQTPQGFSCDLLKEAYRAVKNPEAYTDDSAVVEAFGHPVFIVPGEKRNIKITTETDLFFAGVLMEQRA